MDYVNLGSTGLKVSRLCLGCMSFGEPDRGMHAWTMSEADSRPIISHLTLSPQSHCPVR